MKHLDEDIKAIAMGDQKSRLEYVNNAQWWIGYTQANKILKKLDKLVKEPRSLRMNSILLVGSPGNGKTSILQEFVAKYPPSTEDDVDGLVVPVLYVAAPSVPEEGRFYEKILDAAGGIHKKKESIGQKRAQVINLLRYIKLKVLVIDEIHNLLAGSERKHIEFLNQLRELSSDLRINLVCAGISTAFNAINTDDQLRSRFSPAVLPRWRVDQEDTYRLLFSFEKRLPLREASNLTDPDMVNCIIDRTEGTIGEIVKFLKEAVEHALMEGRERLSLDMMDEVDYISPSQYDDLQRKASDDELV